MGSVIAVALTGEPPARMSITRKLRGNNLNIAVVNGIPLGMKQTGGTWLILRALARRLPTICVVLLVISWELTTALGQTVPVKHAEGLLHGFLLLRSPEGKVLAEGDLMQTTRGNRVTSHLLFRFKDGSVHDDTVVFSQQHHFRFLSEHLVQSGPSFERPINLSINAAKNEISVKYTDKADKHKRESGHFKLPPDLANGMVLTILKNIRPGDAPKLAMIVATPKPKIVKLKVNTVGEETFKIGSSSRKAIHYVVKVDIGGLSGALASLFGKQPPDTHVWILPGEAPAFVRSEGPLYVGGPIWRIELTSPVWPDSVPHK